jgi:hypothetical protein
VYRLTRRGEALTIEGSMTRPWLVPALLLTSACFSPGDIDETLSPGLMPPAETGTPEPSTGEGSTGEGSADGSSDDTPAPPTCTDGMQGEDETDVDCGGSCEPCGNGQGCAVAGDCSSGVCQSEVCISPTCGNGSIEDGEACDDAGESATCNVDCSIADCGDGVLNATAGETCDDAGESATCDIDCSVAACGDGVINVAASEGCDDSGETIVCNIDCTVAACGDGVLNVSAGETCDLGGNAATCDADCTAVSCGDGTFNPAAGEACDDAGETATCDADCSTVQCGDGTINEAAGEQCEGGAGCGADCLFVGCGADPTAQAMAACMAAYPNCTPMDGGIVGHGAGVGVGSNCGPPAYEWRFYCTVTSGTNYNCSACTVGEILGAHEPCNCDPGTSPVLGYFC